MKPLYCSQAAITPSAYIKYNGYIMFPKSSDSMLIQINPISNNSHLFSFHCVERHRACCEKTKVPSWNETVDVSGTRHATTSPCDYYWSFQRLEYMNCSLVYELITYGDIFNDTGLRSFQDLKSCYDLPGTSFCVFVFFPTTQGGT